MEGIRHVAVDLGRRRGDRRHSRGSAGPALHGVRGSVVTGGWIAEAIDAYTKGMALRRAISAAVQPDALAAPDSRTRWAEHSALRGCALPRNCTCCSRTRRADPEDRASAKDAHGALQALRSALDDLGNAPRDTRAAWPAVRDQHGRHSRSRCGGCARPTRTCGEARGPGRSGALAWLAPGWLAAAGAGLCLAGEEPEPRGPGIPRVDDRGACDEIVQRTVLALHQDDLRRSRGRTAGS